MNISLTLITGQVADARAGAWVASSSRLLSSGLRTNPRLSALEQRPGYQPKCGGHVARQWAMADMGAKVGQSTLRCGLTGFSATDTNFPTRVGPPPLSISV